MAISSMMDETLKELKASVPKIDAAIKELEDLIQLGSELQIVTPDQRAELGKLKRQRAAIVDSLRRRGVQVA